MTSTYTPFPTELTATSLPSDGVDLRRVATVNASFQAVADGVLFAYQRADTIKSTVDGLLGVGSLYSGAVSVPATAGIAAGGADPWLPDTADGFLSGMVLQTEGSANPSLVIPLQCLPLVGKIVGYQMLLVGRGPGVGHTVLPQYPFKSELRRRDYSSGSVVIASTSNGVNVATYDTEHVQTSTLIDHDISFSQSPEEWPAVYSIVVYGEYGTNSIVGGCVYGFKIFINGAGT